MQTFQKTHYMFGEEDFGKIFFIPSMTNFRDPIFRVIKFGLNSRFVYLRHVGNRGQYEYHREFAINNSFDERMEEIF